MKEESLIECRGLWLPANTPEKVRAILVRATERPTYQERFRFWFGDPITGQAWQEEFDVCGYVGKTTGSVKVPLLINNRRSYGGQALSADRIVKIVSITFGNVLYEHPSFKQANYTVGETIGDIKKQYPFTVSAGVETWARCETEKYAKRLADFMNGKRHNH